MFIHIWIYHIKKYSKIIWIFFFVKYLKYFGSTCYSHIKCLNTYFEYFFFEEFGVCIIPNNLKKYFFNNTSLVVYEYN